MTMNRIQALVLALGLVLVGIAVARADHAEQAESERARAALVLNPAMSDTADPGVWGGS
jgi:hypothetical protein